MKMIPILLGGDLNAYSMALAFYEAGAAPSYVLGRYRLGATSWSRIVRPVISSRMATDEGRRAMIAEVAARHPDATPVLIGCTDEYASFLIREKETLGERYLIPSPPPYTLRYSDKAVFADACREGGIKTPKTLLLRGDEGVPEVLPFLYPAVMKPAVSEEYWHHPFEGMRKVWFTKSRDEAEKVRKKMRSAGYRGTVLLQERIPAADTDNFVLTVYCDRTARARALAYGRVILEEHTPRGLGNHAVILTEPPPPVAGRLVALLEKIGYRGFANFDLLRDPRGGEPYVLEMNLRQGRSNHYMTASGINPAGLVIADLVLREELPFLTATPDILWHSVPLSVAYSMVKDDGLLRRLRSLEAAGRAVSPFHARGDLARNPLRRLFVWEHERRIRRRSRAPAAE